MGCHQHGRVVRVHQDVMDRLCVLLSNEDEGLLLPSAIVVFHVASSARTRIVNQEALHTFNIQVVRCKCACVGSCFVWCNSISAAVAAPANCRPRMQHLLRLEPLYLTALRAWRVLYATRSTGMLPTSCCKGFCNSGCTLLHTERQCQTCTNGARTQRADQCCVTSTSQKTCCGGKASVSSLWAWNTGTFEYIQHSGQRERDTTTCQHCMVQGETIQVSRSGLLHHRWC